MRAPSVTSKPTKPSKGEKTPPGAGSEPAARSSRRSSARGGSSRRRKPQGRKRRHEDAPAREPDIYSLSESETFKFGEALGRTLLGGEIVVLQGELGTGKTVFARGIASALGIDPTEVGSPTFVLVDRHLGRLTLYHADLYRLDREEQVLDLGLDEFAAIGGVVVVEWGERLPASIREGAIEVRITDLGDDSRKLSLVQCSIR